MTVEDASVCVVCSSSYAKGGLCREHQYDEQLSDQRIEAMAYADNWGFHYSAIQWIDPNAPWVTG